MDRLRQGLVLVAALLLYANIAAAIPFSDDFSTDPFAAPRRWRERWHHVHWDSINLLMSGLNSTRCPLSVDLNGCCSTCPTPGCVSAGDGVHDIHFTPGNPFTVLAGVQVYF